MNKPFSRFWRFGAAPLVTMLILGCQSEPEPRKYREIVTRGDNSTLQGNPRAAMTWTLPAGWSVQPEGDAMRLTGFWAPDPVRVAAGETDPKPVDVSVVQLAGPAGGLEANVTRWLGQIKVQASLAPKAIDDASPVRIASGQEGIIVDFTNLLSGDLTQTESIIGAIVTVGETTVFVKAMGSRERLKRIKPQLIEFCESLSVGASGAYGAEETAP